MSGGSVGYDVGADGVELRRPEARNALGAAMRAGLWEAFRRFRDDETARVMLLCSQGPHFCAGGDLKEMAETGLDRPPADLLPVPGRTIDLAKPVVAAVQGAAHGGGFLFAQSSDLVVAGESASFGITEARWGRGAPWASSLPDLIGTRRALELLLTADASASLSVKAGKAIGLRHPRPRGRRCRRARRAPVRARVRQRRRRGGPTRLPRAAPTRMDRLIRPHAVLPTTTTTVRCQT